MNVSSVTVGIPVSDLTAARRWYEQVLELGAPVYEPVDGVVEYAVSGSWLQLFQEEAGTPGRWVLRLGVPDVAAQRDRLLAQGVAAGELIAVEGAVTYFEFADPDGNLLSYYTEA